MRCWGVLWGVGCVMGSTMGAVGCAMCVRVGGAHLRWRECAMVLSPACVMHGSHTREEDAWRIAQDGQAEPGQSHMGCWGALGPCACALEHA
jgi:hypothetical protein